MKSSVFDKISKISLYLLAVLVPLWILPVTQNILEYQKQTLLIALVFVGIISWLAKMVYGGELRIQNTWLHLTVVGVLAAVGISTAFSAFRYGSFWGRPLDSTDNLLTFVGFALLYFLVSQSIKNKKQLAQVFSAFVVSGGVAVLFALLQLKGIFVFSLAFAQSAAFNTLGSANSVAMISAILLPLTLALALSFSEDRFAKFYKGVLWGTVAVLVSSVALLNFFAAWVVMIVGLVILVVFDMVRRQRLAPETNGKSARPQVSVPMILVLIGLLFLIVGDLSVPGAPTKQIEVSLGYTGELGIVRGVISENPVAAALGTGPGTFVYDYAKFRSPESNRGIFWAARFASGKAEILDWVITKGIVGLLALFFLLGLAISLSVRGIIKRSDDIEASFAADGKDSRNQGSALLVGFLGSFAAFGVGIFLYPANFAMWFLFWMLAGGIAFLISKEKNISLSSGSSFGALGASLCLMIILLSGISILFLGAQRYYAEFQYFEGLRLSARGEVREATAKMQSAAQRNSQMDMYWRDLAQLYLQQANELAEDTSIPADVRQQQTGVMVNNAVKAANRAKETDANNVANWNVRGFLYRSLIGIPEADRFAMESYEKSRDLEPASPFPWTELGRVKILSTQGGGDQKLEEAVEDLKKAIELKPDYAPAHYLIAIAYDQLGNQQEAIKALEETKFKAPNDVGLAFQLGTLYYRQSELGKARDEFERTRAINPRYSNARYMLGLVYDRLGRKEDARAEFAAVAALNPDNEEVKTILENLTAGREALEGIGAPSEPPIADTPEEIEPEEAELEEASSLEADEREEDQ